MNFPGRAKRRRGGRGPRSGRRTGGAGVELVPPVESGATARLILKPGREHSLERRHPWVFSGAVAALSGEVGAGDTVMLCTSEGRFLAWAAYNPHSQIRARVWSFNADEFPDDEWLRARLIRAIEGRATTVSADATNAMRLVHAESDGLPGVVIDRYADTVVLQLASAGADRRRDTIVAIIAEATKCKRIFERSDADSRALEGLPERVGALHGDAPTGMIEIHEHGLRYRVDVIGGQKTGFYLDQRDSRAKLRARSYGLEVLNCFCFTGGFSLACLAGGAKSVLSIDSSAAALAIARDNAAQNGMDESKLEWRQADVFQALRELRDRARSFDLIALDPPRFAPTSKHAPAAARGYKDINMGAMRLLRPGGLLATFSCSSGVSEDLFHKIVAGAAADAGICATILDWFHAAPDHPSLLEFPEGDYLKGLLLRREGG
ncbi:MAG: methyltransferase domain-containing protein [Betaproteobacteria bacterium]|nr:methyltransferase domain-containing protein [Betaproteobacteria bacterium]